MLDRSLSELKYSIVFFQRLGVQKNPGRRNNVGIYKIDDGDALSFNDYIV
jgi:hypothetical protein